MAAAVDVLVSVGGGSATGLAKAIALRTRLPIIAVPTTYAGSEATPIWGLTTDRHKETGSDPAVLPVSVVYDADLTLSLPLELSVASGLNGLAHCIDAMWAPRADPINTALALDGIRALSAGLLRVVDDPAGRLGRSECLYGAYLSGRAFGAAGSGRTTSSAMSWVVPSTCPTPRPTPSSCRTCWLSTHPRSRRSPGGSPTP